MRRTVRPPSRSHDNDFDAIRLVAAVTVLIGHVWPMTGHGRAPAIGHVAVYTIAVWIFFATSGFLISQSWDRTRSTWRFLVRRVARIFPALWIVVLVTIFGLGPLVSTLPPGDYFSHPVTWSYAQNLTLLASYDLPGVFGDNPLHAVNGSLWTLGPEFCCYLAVLIVGLIANRRRSALLAPLGLGLAVLAILPAGWLHAVQPTLTACAFFAGGAIIARLWPAGDVPGRWLIVAAGVLVLGVFLPEPAQVTAWFIGVPLVVIGLGARRTPVVRRASRFGDFSYGIYVWGFVVEQIVVHYLGVGDPIVVGGVSLAVTGALAGASWWLVERRMIALGRRWTQHRAVAAFDASPGPSREVAAASQPHGHPSEAVATVPEVDPRQVRYDGV